MKALIAMVQMDIGEPGLIEIANLNLERKLDEKPGVQLFHSNLFLNAQKNKNNIGGPDNGKNDNYANTLPGRKDPPAQSLRLCISDSSVLWRFINYF